MHDLMPSMLSRGFHLAAIAKSPSTRSEIFFEALHILRRRHRVLKLILSSLLRCPSLIERFKKVVEKRVGYSGIQIDGVTSQTIILESRGIGPVRDFTYIDIATAQI